MTRVNFKNAVFNDDLIYYWEEKISEPAWPCNHFISYQ